MFQRFLITAFIVTAPGWVVAQSVNTSEQPIVNGSRSPLSLGLKAEEILAVGALTNYGDPSSAFCTGTAITNRVVITAAHCIVREGGSQRTAQDISFAIGESPEIENRIYDVSQVAFHPDYDPNSDNPQMEDVAVLLLASDLTDQAPELQPIEFNRHPLEGLDRDALLEGDVEIAGYGSTQTSETGRFFTSVALVEVTDLTVLIDGEGLRGACRGDSGGPVIKRNMRQAPVVLGVLRGGSETCVGRDHYVRLDVPHVRDWVENQIMRTWPTYPEGSVCANLSFYGRCVANHVEYCDQNFRVTRIDCQSGGVAKSCSFLNLDDGYDCRPSSTCESGICKSRFDGFLPPAPLAIVNVGGCHLKNESSPHWLWFSLVILLTLRRRC